MATVIVIVSMVAGLVGLMHVGGRYRVARDARPTLRELARRRGAPAHVEDEISSVELELEERGVAVTVAIGVRDRVQYWEARVEIPPPGLPRFSLACADHGPPARTDLQATTIECSDVAVRGLLTAWTRDRRPLLHSVTIRGYPATLVLRRAHWRVLSVDALETDLSMALDVASLDVYGLAVLKQLPDATFHAGSEPCVTIAGPGEIRIGLRRVGEELRTYARCAIASDRPSADVLAALGATLEVGTERLTLAWPAIERDPKRLVAAIELLRSLARAPSLGVFR